MNASQKHQLRITQVTERTQLVGCVIRRAKITQRKIKSWRRETEKNGENIVLRLSHCFHDTYLNCRPTYKKTVLMQWSRRARKWKYSWALRERESVFSKGGKNGLFKLSKMLLAFISSFLEILQQAVQSGQPLSIIFGQSRYRGCPFTSSYSVSVFIYELKN